MTDFASCLAELETVTRELAAAAAPEELARMQRLLARRQAALQLLAADEEAAAGAHSAGQLQLVYEAGQSAAERLRLVQAGLREQLREMHRVGVTLRALGAPSALVSAEDHSIDYRA